MNGRMRLYTSTGTRKIIEQCNRLNIGLLMVNVWRNPEDWPYFAVDNGCFSAYNCQEPWNPAPFLNILDRCKRSGLIPEFIVIPDKVASSDSLQFSLTWLPILETMYPDFPRYMAIQNGMTTDLFDDGLLKRLDGFFIGGTMDWKLENMKTWIDFAHANGKQCHVGRIGPVKRMMMCEIAGADSIDSTTWVQRRNGMERYVGSYNSQRKIVEFEND